MNFLNGQIMAFDKPYGVTSFNVVGRTRHLISKAMGGKRLRVGHAGTLDPLATGVLIVCTGRATKIIEQLQAGSKEYIAEIALGATTPSFDLETPIDAEYPTDHITPEHIKNTLPQFLGEIMQTPPAYSACKIEGKRAYDLARRGEEVKLKAKPLRIDEIEWIDNNLPHSITLRIVCGKGTYIRALARDIGKALNTGAHLLSLRRTRVGDFNIEKCWNEKEFETWLAEQNIDSTTPDGPIPSEFPRILPALKSE